MASNKQPKTSNKYIIQSLYDGLVVLKRFLEELQPYQAYSMSELNVVFGIEYGKLNRILKTLQKAGFLDTDSTGKKIRISQDLLSVPYKHLAMIYERTQEIKQQFQTFEQLIGKHQQHEQKSRNQSSGHPQDAG
ncbi:MAG: hypothetical protein ACE5I1_03930 [bacterium]